MPEPFRESWVHKLSHSWSLIPLGPPLHVIAPLVSVECRGGVVVRTFASHKCGLGLNTSMNAICLLLVLVLAFVRIFSRYFSFLFFL